MAPEKVRSTGKPEAFRTSGGEAANHLHHLLAKAAQELLRFFG